MAVKSRPKSMPKWRPAPASLIQQFAGAVERIPSVEQRKMFGYPAAFLNGNMFAGLFQDHVVVRLSVEDRAELGRTAAKKGKKPSPTRKGRGQ